MSHPHEQDLLLFLGADHEEGATIAAHVDGCPECSRRLQSLRSLIALTREAHVPEPDAGFEGRIWARQRADLAARGALSVRVERDAASTPAATGPSEATPTPFPGRWTPARRLLAIGSLAAALAVAFLIGLYTPPPGSAPAPSAGTVQEADRALLVALGGHLERSRRVLVEVSNARVVDVSSLALQQTRARELIADNRLYRQSATLAGLPEYAAILDEIERVLLELARGGPGAMTADRLQWLRTRIGERDLLFRSRVLQSHASDRGAATAPPAGDPLA